VIGLEPDAQAKGSRFDTFSLACASGSEHKLNMPIRIVIPYHLKLLAQVTGEVQVEVAEPVTLKAALDALEAQYPMLCGTSRDHVTSQRRAFLRFFACERDFSNDPPETLLPAKVANGEEPLLVVGAIAGG
jgi:sulfur-carrier protein